jgi:hypothetical protein
MPRELYITPLTFKTFTHMSPLKGHDATTNPHDFVELAVLVLHSSVFGKIVEGLESYQL